MSGTPPDCVTGVLESTWGDIVVTAGERGVWRCDLPEPPAGAPEPWVRTGRARAPKGAPALLREALEFARAALEGVEGIRPPKVHPDVWRQASPYQREVWRVLQRIPRGRVLTYAEVARRAGRPAAVRAAGGACGANPLALFIPCHRVVAAHGGLGGFSGGLGWKRGRLPREGVTIGADAARGK